MKEGPNLWITDLEIDEEVAFGGGDTQEVVEEWSIVIWV